MGGFSTSWGSSSSYDWDDKATRKSARDYAKSDNRSYTGHNSNGIAPPVGVNIATDSPLAQILVVDVTGSMRSWPSLIFEKIPALYTECNAAMQGFEPEDLKEGNVQLEDILKTSVIAIDDARQRSSHPIQVVDFSSGADLVKGVNEIYPVGGGGGNEMESYDLAAYFITRHCKTPNMSKGAKPTVIIAGDEGFYPDINRDEIKRYMGDDLKRNLKTTTLMERLARDFDTYLLRPELSYYPSTYARIHKEWQDVLGPQNVLKMDDPARLVDCIIGISAFAADSFDQGIHMLERRQTKGQVKEVLRTLHPLTGD
jgi:hypothetical protein